MTSILVEAYVETDYRVHGEHPFVLHIGQRSLDLLTAQKKHVVSCSAFITAWNPYSQVVDTEVNTLRQNTLREELQSRSLIFIPGIGQHPSNKWPGEESFLIFGLDLAAAKALGQRFEQNAIVWSGTDAVPQLVLLREVELV